MPAVMPAPPSGPVRCRAASPSKSKPPLSSAEPAGEMNDTGETITLRVHGAIAEIAPEAWDACAGDINPTVSHVFLNALEESGSTTARTGWAPQHLTFAGEGGRLVGAVPLYLKSHSYGEYIFDWVWAAAYERSGARAYP